MSDLDDTLVERPPLFRSWAEGFLSEQDADPALLAWVVELDRGGHRPREEFLSTLAERVGYEVAVEEFLLDYNRTLAGSYRLVPDARAVLEEARERGWRLAVVTNGLTDVQSLKLSVSGIADLADAVCISEEVGVSKPDPLIFRTAAERAGTTLQGALQKIAINQLHGSDVPVQRRFKASGALWL